MQLRKIVLYFLRLKIKIYNKILSRAKYMQKYCYIQGKYGVKFGNKLPRFIDPSVELDYSAEIYIGEHTTIAAGTTILTHDYSIDYGIKSISKNKKSFNVEYKVAEKVSIGNAVFIGQRVIILPGVNIGNNSIVGAGSLV